MRAIDADAAIAYLENHKKVGKENGYILAADEDAIIKFLKEKCPTITPPNEPLTWEELKAETKINPVYSMKYGWIFPSTVKDEPYKQVWFFTSKGFANTELFYRDTFYRRPPEGEV